MKKTEWIDVHDDELMVNLGIRLPKYENVVWDKTAKEKKEIKHRRSKFEDPHFRSYKRVSTPVVADLIIYLKKNDKFPNTTYSDKCELSKVRNILNFYKSNKAEILKYCYNGKTYMPEEDPFYYY